MNLPNGIYNAAILNYNRGVSSTGKPQIEVVFTVDAEGSPRLYWYGYLTTEGAMKITMRALAAMGMKADSPTDALDQIMKIGQDGNASGVLDADKPVSITVENETYEGKTRPKVKWINAPRKDNPFAGVASELDLKRAFTAPDLKATLASVFSEVEMPKKSGPLKKASGDDDVGF